MGNGLPSEEWPLNYGSALFAGTDSAPKSSNNDLFRECPHTAVGACSKTRVKPNQPHRRHMITSASRSGVSTAVIVGIVVVVVAIAAVAGYVLLSPRAVKTVQVAMPSGVGNNQSLNFSPSKLTVVIGVNNTIEWVNQDSVSHTVIATGAPSGGRCSTRGARQCLRARPSLSP